MASLGRAADLGFAFTATMLRDPDLDSIRAHPGLPRRRWRAIRGEQRAARSSRSRSRPREGAKVLVFPRATEMRGSRRR